MFRKVLGSRTPVNVQPEFKSLITAAKRRFCTQLLHWAARLLFRRRGETHHATYVRTVIKSAVALGFAATMAMGALFPPRTSM
jgi:hypothetical protein